MHPGEDEPGDVDLIKTLREYTTRSRGYASFFEWPLDRDAGELGVVDDLQEAMAAAGVDFFTDPVSRGRPDDPPDCEAKDFEERRIAIEVTEFVSGEAIPQNMKARRHGGHRVVADWTQDEFLAALGSLLQRKDARGDSLKGGPYPGGYVVLIHCDETMLDPTAVGAYLHGHTFRNMLHVTRAFLLLSYMPEAAGRGSYPYFELRLSREP